jgi:hypothetical protein
MLAAYAPPMLGDASVQAINTALIMKVIEPIWAGKRETAARWLQLWFSYKASIRPTSNPYVRDTILRFSSTP